MTVRAGRHDSETGDARRYPGLVPIHQVVPLGRDRLPIGCNRQVDALLPSAPLVLAEVPQVLLAFIARCEHQLPSAQVRQRQRASANGIPQPSQRCPGCTSVAAERNHHLLLRLGVPDRSDEDNLPVVHLRHTVRDDKQLGRKVRARLHPVHKLQLRRLYRPAEVLRHFPCSLPFLTHLPAPENGCQASLLGTPRSRSAWPPWCGSFSCQTRMTIPADSSADVHRRTAGNSP